jgi:SH3 domain protein
MGLPTVNNDNFRISALIPALLLFVGAWAGAARAETAYVTDMLQLGVHGAPDTSDTAFTFLKSADSVEVLERNLFYARVRIADGREGWVRTTFLVDEPPPRLRVETVENERDRTAADLEKLRGRFNQQKSKLSELEGKISTNEAGVRAEQEELEQLRAANDDLDERLETYRYSLPIFWFLIGIILSLGAGVFAGWWWLDNRSRMRHGGFRVY